MRWQAVRRPPVARPCSSPIAFATDNERRSRLLIRSSGIFCLDRHTCLGSADVPCWWQQRNHLSWWVQLQGEWLLPCDQTRAAVLPCRRQWWNLMPWRVQLCGCWLLQDPLTSPVHRARTWPNGALSGRQGVRFGSSGVLGRGKDERPKSLGRRVQDARQKSQQPP